MRRTDAAAARAAAALEPLLERFAGQTALIFASGPSLPSLWNADRAIPLPSIAVSDAWLLAPGADVLYASDGPWWLEYKGVTDFAGVKVGCADGFGLPAGVIQLQISGIDGFDERLGWFRTGTNSGHAAAHLAAQLGAARVVLVGFDMRRVDGKDRWFGEHPERLRRRNKDGSPYPKWVGYFETLGEALAKRGVELVNATPGSALTPAFGHTPLEDVI